MSDYAWSVDLPVAADVAVERVTAALAAQGFGVLTRIDVHEVFAKKLGIQRAPYIILGACAPQFARQAIEADPAMGILLPCNVVVEGLAAGTRVWITRPDAVMGVAGREDLRALASEVGRRLEAARDALAAT